MKATRLKKSQFDEKRQNVQESKFHRIDKLCAGQCDGVLLDSATLYSEALPNYSVPNYYYPLPQTVDENDSRWVKATAKARRKRLNDVAKAVVEGSRRKYQKDYDRMKDLNLPEDRRITCSNRAIGKF